MSNFYLHRIWIGNPTRKWQLCPNNYVHSAHQKWGAALSCWNHELLLAVTEYWLDIYNIASASISAFRKKCKYFLPGNIPSMKNRSYILLCGTYLSPNIYILFKCYSVRIFSVAQCLQFFLFISLFMTNLLLSGNKIFPES